MVIYIIGSLRNPKIPELGQQLREAGHEAFDDWYSAGPKADDHWQEYEKSRGHPFSKALQGYAAQHVFHFDRRHLMRADVVVLAMPAGKSGHLEFGYAMGLGKLGYILLDKEPERFDVMYAFATGVVNSATELIQCLSSTSLVPSVEQTPGTWNRISAMLRL